MKHTPLEESTVAAVAERLKYGWEGGSWTDIATPPNGRGYADGNGHAYGTAPGYGYIIGGGRGYPSEAAGVGFETL